MLNEDGFIDFHCDHCQTEIEASPDMIGETTECPACGQKLIIPDLRDEQPSAAGTEEPTPAQAQASKSRTIRIELGDL